MVPTLVILTIVAFLIADAYLVRRTRRAASRRGLLFHPGHSWLRIDGEGLALVGASEFASNFAGNLRGVELPKPGDWLFRGERGWTWLGTGGRRLSQAMPIGGTVVDVNPRVLEHPGLAQVAPYAGGWLLRVRPRGLRRALKGLRSGEAAARWMDGVRARVAGRLSPATGQSAYDGGEWTRGFGQRLTDDQWETLRAELFPDVDDR